MMLKRIVLVACSIGMSVLTIALCYFFAEMYFFDRLFYQKSALHGYTSNIGDSASDPGAPSVIKKRLKDTLEIINIAHEKSGKNSVLGAQIDNAYTIIVIGDSYVYGQGIKMEQRFSELLENILNKKYPTNVIIFAQPGDGIIENYAKFLLAHQYIDPDLYIIAIVDNDFVFNPFDKYPGQSELRLALQNNCPGKTYVMKDFPPDISWEDIVVKEYGPSISPDYQNVCMLKKIAEDISQTSSQVLYYSFYKNETSSDDKSLLDKTDAEVMHVYTSTIRQAGGYVIYQPDSFIYEQVSEKDGHPSAKTNIWFAEQLYNEIISNPKWKFPPTRVVNK